MWLKEVIDPIVNLMAILGAGEFVWEYSNVVDSFLAGVNFMGKSPNIHHDST